jgi:hypothetical protein
MTSRPLETPTPRCDKELLDVQAIAIESDPRNKKRGIKRDYVPIDFARTLERELSRANARLAELDRYFAKCRKEGLVP